MKAGDNSGIVFRGACIHGRGPVRLPVKWKSVRVEEFPEGTVVYAERRSLPAMAAEAIRRLFCKRR